MGAEITDPSKQRKGSRKRQNRPVKNTKRTLPANSRRQMQWANKKDIVSPWGYMPTMDSELKTTFQEC